MINKDNTFLEKENNGITEAVNEALDSLLAIICETNRLF
jgi:hypothetical protein